MLGAAVIVVVLVVILPAAFLVGGAVLAAVLGSKLDGQGSRRPRSGDAGH